MQSYCGSTQKKQMSFIAFFCLFCGRCSERELLRPSSAKSLPLVQRAALSLSEQSSLFIYLHHFSRYSPAWKWDPPLFSFLFLLFEKTNEQSFLLVLQEKKNVRKTELICLLCGAEAVSHGPA